MGSGGFLIDRAAAGANALSFSRINFTDVVDPNLHMGTGEGLPLVESLPLAFDAGSEIAIDECEFNDFVNTTFLFVDLSSTGIPSSLTVRSSNFTNNLGANLTTFGRPCCAGAIEVPDANGSSLDIFDSSFSNNIGNGNGGALNWFVLRFSDQASPPVRIANSTFTMNSVQDGNSGGAVYVEGPDAVSIESSTFTMNSAPVGNGSGGAVFVRNVTTEFTIADSIFSENDAALEGGAVFVRNVTTGFTITGSTFVGNEATDNGGALSSAGPVEIADSRFSSNTAGGDGGAVAFESSTGDAAVSSTIFSENSAGSFGGCVSATEIASLQISDSDFTENSAFAAGGLFATGIVGSTDILGCEFRDNTAFTVGGAVQARASPTSDLRIADSGLRSSLFLRNRAQVGSAGAVFILFQQSVTSVGANYTANVAQVLGGGIISTDSGPVNLTSNAFERNTAGSQGGAAFFQDTTGSLPLFTNVSNTFVDNVAFQDPNLSVTGFST